MAAVVLLLATTASLTGFWVRDTIVDEDGWNSTLGDLLDDDAVADEVASIVTDRTIETVLASAIDLPFVSGAIEEAATGPLTETIGPVVAAAVRSEIGATVWSAAVATVHDDVVAILRDDSTTLVDGSTIRLDLTPLAVQIASRLDDALGPVGSFGISEVVDVDLTIVLYDLSEHDTSLAVGSSSERLRVVLLLLSVAAAGTLVATGSRRPAALAGVGVLLVVSAVAFRIGLAVGEPDGLDATWSHVAGTADGMTWAVAGIGIVTVLAAAGRRAVRSDAVSDPA